MKRRWIDVESIVEELDYKIFYKSLVKSFRECSSEQAQGICPFHDDHNPSLSMNIKNGLWNCFGGCGGGNVFSFYMKLKDVNFRTAIKEIQNASNRQFN